MAKETLVELRPFTVSYEDSNEMEAASAVLSPMAAGDITHGIASVATGTTGLYSGFNTWLVDTDRISGPLFNGSAYTVVLDLGVGNGRIVTGYRVSATGTTAPKDWTLQGSDSTSGPWNIVDAVTGQTGWSSPGVETRAFTCDVTATPYRYYKIVVTAGNGAAQTGLSDLLLIDPTYDNSLQFAVSGADLDIGLCTEPQIAAPWNIATLSDQAPAPGGTGGNACF